MKIRPTITDDLPALKEVLDATDLFPAEMLPDMISGFLSGKGSSDIWLACEVNNKAVGFCYVAPEELTQGTWNMLAIAILPAEQGVGYGSALVSHLETALKERGQRILIVDTSGKEEFQLTREFYRRNGYAEEARIRDFWAPGDDKVIFWKSLV